MAIDDNVTELPRAQRRNPQREYAAHGLGDFVDSVFGTSLVNKTLMEDMLLRKLTDT